MKNVFFIIMLLFATVAVKSQPFQRDGLWGVEYKAKDGNTAMIPPIFDKMDGNYVYWGKIPVRYSVSDGVLQFGLDGFKIEDSHTAILMASIGKLPEEWTIHDLDRKILPNNMVFFSIRPNYRQYSNFISYTVLLNNGKTATAMLFLDEYRICIFE